MKKNLLSVIVCVLALSILTIISCKKEKADTEAPQITLRGNAIQYVKLNDTYIEHGANASDTQDGDLTASINYSSSTVNTKKVGKYTVSYLVLDKSGNSATATRTVYVYIDVKFNLVGTYDVTYHENDTTDSTYEDQIDTSTVDPIAFTVSRFGNYYLGKVKMMLSKDQKDSVTIPTQVVVCGNGADVKARTFSGGGYIENDGLTIFVKYTEKRDTITVTNEHVYRRKH